MATLDDIVSAAAKVFRTKGYHAATVRDIADEVGLLKGSLYHHFDSKEELLYLVVKEPIAQMYSTMAEIAAGDGRAGDKLCRAISAHLEAFDRHYPHLFVYLREREAVKRRFREKIGFSPKDYERCWQQILREGVASGEFRSDLDIQVASYGLLGMLNWLYKWYDPQGRLSVQEVAEQFTTLALAGLAADESGAISPAKPKRTRLKPALYADGPVLILQLRSPTPPPPPPPPPTPPPPPPPSHPRSPAAARRVFRRKDPIEFADQRAHIIVGSRTNSTVISLTLSISLLPTLVRVDSPFMPA